VKVPGRKSGFLAMDAVRAARNAQVCLVPEFGYDLYGERGLLAYIANRIQMKGHCIIVYSEGASYAARDVPEDLYDEILQRKEGLEDSSFDQFVKGELEKVLAERRL
jgi:6-phosphofructokinase